MTEVNGGKRKQRVRTEGRGSERRKDGQHRKTSVSHDHPIACFDPASGRGFIAECICVTKIIHVHDLKENASPSVGMCVFFGVLQPPSMQIISPTVI